MNTLEFAKSQTRKQCEKYAAQYETSIKELFFGDNVLIFWNHPILEFSFEDGYVIYSDSNDAKEAIGAQFTCAYKTTKGYISSKKINILVADCSNVTIAEADELLKFNTDAVKNNFNPFWKETQAKDRCSAAWNFVASNYLQDDCR